MFWRLGSSTLTPRDIMLVVECCFSMIAVTLDGFRSWVTSLVHSLIRVQDILGSYTDL